MKFKLPKPLNSKITEVDGIEYEKLPSGSFFLELNLEKHFCLCGEAPDITCAFLFQPECERFYPRCRKENIYFKRK